MRNDKVLKQKIFSIILIGLGIFGYWFVDYYNINYGLYFSGIIFVIGLFSFPGVLKQLGEITDFIFSFEGLRTIILILFAGYGSYLTYINLENTIKDYFCDYEFFKNIICTEDLSEIPEENQHIPLNPGN